MNRLDEQHLAWIARSFGRRDYAPLLPSDIALLSEVGTSVSKYPGTHLFKEGEIAGAAFLIRTGEVELYRGKGEDVRVVGRVGPGFVLGDIALFGEGEYVSSAKVIGHVDAFQLDRERLLPELARHPAICLRWLVSSLHQLEGTQLRVLRLLRKTALEQVADLLLEETRESGSVAITQESIGSLLGASRQTVNESLKALREAGAIQTAYGRIEVTDRSVVASMAGESLDGD